MKFGVLMFATEYAVRIDTLAKAVEERGFESLWLPEHTHIPTSRQTPWPGGGPLPREYSHVHDPFVVMATAAAATTTLRLGTGVCLVTERDPITLAKAIASLDVLSGGRVIFGIGAGWNVEELRNHGTDFKTRWKLLRERVLAMKEIWTKDEPEFHGEFVDFDRMWLYPKPVQKPHPQILLGGGPAVLRHVVDYCDGWLPLAGRGLDVPAAVRDLRRRAEAAGRDPDTIRVTAYGANPDPATIEQFREVGIERVVFGLPSAERDVVWPLLDTYETLARTVTP